MRIGLTFDLKTQYPDITDPEFLAELDDETTIEAIEAAINKHGWQTERIGNVKQLLKRLNAGDSWDLIFNIAEGTTGSAREAQIPTLLELWDIPYTFSSPLTLSLALDKSYTKAIVRDQGIRTADSWLISTSEQIPKLLTTVANPEKSLGYPLFVKPAREGSSKGISSDSRVTCDAELRKITEFLLTRYAQPVLVETYLPGMEITVGIAGTGQNSTLVGAMQIDFIHPDSNNLYSLATKANYQQWVEYLPLDQEMTNFCADAALQIHRLLDCRDAARYDFRCDSAGQPNFIEVNPLPGLNPVWSDLPILASLQGIDYQTLMDRILDSAEKRIKA